MNALARRWRPALAGLLLLFAVLYPVLFPAPLDTQFAVNTAMYVGAVVAWNIFSGYSGYISLGHAVFFGTGAYTAGLLAYHQDLNTAWVFATLPLAGLAAAIIAVPFGLIALRVRRHTFVVVTIAVFFIFQLMAFNLSFTGGNDGVAPPLLPFSFQTYNDPFYYLALAIALLAIVLSWLIRRSRFGLQLLAIRDDEDRARGLGVRAMQVKLTAFVISAGFTGVIGGLWILFLGQAYPQTAFNPVFDLTVALMAFLGGFGTLWGPMVGALLLEPLLQYVTLKSTAGYVGQMFMGALFLLVILFLPRGLLPTLSERMTSLRARRERLAAGAVVPGRGGALAANSAGGAATPEGGGSGGGGARESGGVR